MAKVKSGFHIMLIFILTMALLVTNHSTVSATSDFSVTAAEDAEVYTYAHPAKYQASTDYELKVNGLAVPVIKAYSDYDYAHFSVSEGLITYELTILNTDKVHEYSISPMKLGITASKVEGRTITFTTDNPEYLIVMMNNRIKRMIIVGDSVETDIPASSGEGVFNITEAPYVVSDSGELSSVTERTSAIQSAINDASAYGTAQGDGTQGIVYIPAGQYYIGNLVMKSHSALYLEPGAALIGTGKADDYTRHWYKDSKQQPVTWWISTEFNSENIRIYGRGTLDGNGSALTGDRSSSTHTKGMINNLVVPIATQNFTMDGVIVRESSAWAVTPIRSNDLEFTNLKIFNSLGMSENDGIDVNESQNVLVKNVIGIALDDPFSTKAWAAHTDIASGTVPWPGVPEQVNNVLFEDLIAWSLCYGYKVGQGVEQDQSNITFRNGVVYRAAVGFGIHHKWGSGKVSNVTFENMDVEQIRGKNDDNSSWMTIHSLFNSSGVGPISGVIASNITVREQGETFGKIKGHETALITNVTLENVYMPDSSSSTGISSTPATRLVELNFLLLEHYEDVTILPWQNREPRSDGNLALNKPAFISAEDKVNVETVHLAFDGKMNTRAGTARTDSEWIYVDLQSKQTINEVRLYWEGAYGKSYEIRVSDDAENWKTVYSTTNGNGGTDIILLDDVEARYVQMFGLQRATQYGYSLWEFEVYLQNFTSYDVVLDKREISLEIGEQEQLTATVLPENTLDQTVSWSSSNNEVATVDEQGLVTALAPGTAVITVVTNDSGLDAHATLTVLGPDDGGETGGNDGGETGGNDGGETGGNDDGETGGNDGGETGGNNGGETGGNDGGETGGNDGGETGGNDGGETGGNSNVGHQEVEATSRIITVDNVVGHETLVQAFAKYDDVVIVANDRNVTIPASALLSVNKLNARMTVQTQDGTLVIPLSAIKLNDLAAKFGVAVEELSISISVKKVSDQVAAAITSQINALGGKQLAESVDFEVSVKTKEGEAVIIHSYGNTYISRTIPLQSSFDPSKTTGVVYNAENGELSFVPTQFTEQDGQQLAVLKRTSNSIYTVISVDKSFEDIKEHWGKDDIELMANKLILMGVNETQFDPNREITRAEFAAVLIRSLGLSQSATDKTFSDVPAAAWYADEVAIAADAGLIRGYSDGTFRANKVITRAELATMVVRAVEFTGLSIDVSSDEETEILSLYMDNTDVKWGRTELAAAIKAGFIHGKHEMTLDWTEGATRAQAAVILTRYLSYVGFINSI